MSATPTTIPAWHHGGIGWACATVAPTPLSAFGEARREAPIQHGIHKGRTAVLALCPLCASAGRETWVRISIKPARIIAGPMEALQAVTSIALAAVVDNADMVQNDTDNPQEQP